MRITKILSLIAFLIITTLAFAQTPQEIIQDFNQPEYEEPDWRVFGNICPWQSIRHSFRQSLQIDIQCNELEYQALLADKHIIANDLYNYFMGTPKSSLEIYRRGYFTWIHTSANPHPHLKFFDIQHAANYLDQSVDNPYFGWYWSTFYSGKLAIAAKILPSGLFHLSFAILINFKGYNDSRGNAVYQTLPTRVTQLSLFRNP